MSIRTIISRVAVVRSAPSIVMKNFSNSPLPDEVLDMSINGLQISVIGAAIINHFKMGSADPPQQPLGRYLRR